MRTQPLRRTAQLPTTANQLLLPELERLGFLLALSAEELGEEAQRAETGNGPLGTQTFVLSGTLSITETKPRPRSKPPAAKSLVR